MICLICTYFNLVFYISIFMSCSMPYFNCDGFTGAGFVDHSLLLMNLTRLREKQKKTQPHRFQSGWFSSVVCSKLGYLVKDVRESKKKRKTFSHLSWPRKQKWRWWKWWWDKLERYVEIPSIFVWRTMYSVGSICCASSVMTFKIRSTTCMWMTNVPYYF